MNTIAAVDRPLVADYVSKDPAILGGKPCIKGTRIRVQDIYVFHEAQGMSVDQIIAGWPHLTHAQVHGALAYAWEHRDEILALLKKEDEFYEKLTAQQPSLTEKAMARLHAKSA